MSDSFFRNVTGLTARMLGLYFPGNSDMYRIGKSGEAVSVYIPSPRKPEQGEAMMAFAKAIRANGLGTAQPVGGGIEAHITADEYTLGKMNAIYEQLKTDIAAKKESAVMHLTKDITASILTERENTPVPAQTPAPSPLPALTPSPKPFFTPTPAPTPVKKKSGPVPGVQYARKPSVPWVNKKPVSDANRDVWTISEYATKIEEHFSILATICLKDDGIDRTSGDLCELKSVGGQAAITLDTAKIGFADSALAAAFAGHVKTVVAKRNIEKLTIETSDAPFPVVTLTAPMTMDTVMQLAVAAQQTAMSVAGEALRNGDNGKMMAVLRIHNPASAETVASVLRDMFSHSRQ